MNRFLPLLILVYVLTGCKRESAVEPEPEIDDATGIAYAFKNNVAWEAKMKISQSDTTSGQLSLFIYRESSPGRNRETLLLQHIAPVLGVQSLLAGSPNTTFDDMASYYVFDVDVIFDLYALDSTATDNFIEITGYDPERLEIEGVFNVALALEYEEADPVYRPEKLRFRQGSFVTSVAAGWFD